MSPCTARVLHETSRGRLSGVAHTTPAVSDRDRQDKQPQSTGHSVLVGRGQGSLWPDSIRHRYVIRSERGASPLSFGSGVKTPPANAGDTGPTPGPGRSCLPQSN